MPVELKALPPAEAIRYFRSKGYRVGFDWRDVWNQEHRRAFTVAKAMQLDILSDIRGAVDAALADGTTFAAFRADLEPTLKAKGWWGRAQELDPLTGETREVQLGSPRRLRIIYDTNLRGAYAAGRWERIERVKARRPFLRYVAIGDERTRPAHMAWHGTVLPVDHPFWNTHYPPNGWRCRCIVQQMSQRDLDRSGLTESRSAPPKKRKPYKNKRTGETIHVPEGIDPGFAFNTGKGRGRRAGREAEAHKIYADKVDQAAPDVARNAMDIQRASRDFADMAGGKQNGAMPIAVLPRRIGALIGAKGGQAVRFSRDTAEKQINHHPHLTPADYRALQTLIDEGEATLDRSRHVVFHGRIKGDLWRAVVKATHDGRELYLISLFRDNARGVETVRRRGEQIKK